MLLLFDLESSLIESDNTINKDMLNFLYNLRDIKIGIISDYNIEEIKLLIKSNILKLFDYVFCENGMIYFSNNSIINANSIKLYLSEDNLNKFISKCLIYIDNINLPKIGTYIDFKNDMINIKPVGNNFLDKNENDIRLSMIEYLKKEFDYLDLEYMIKEDNSFVVYPKKFNKIIYLEYLNDIKYIHYFGRDNNFLNNTRVIGHNVNNYLDIINIYSNIFKSYIPVILCGGSGSRLFPKSKKNFPKQFIKINSNYSLLQNTILRFKHLNHIILVSNISHRHIIEYQLNELNLDIKFEIYLEPSGRNTAPAINLITQLKPDNRLLFLPCDHIYDNDILLQTINNALQQDELIITFGIKPTYPETGFGYLEYNLLGYLNKFIEKPNKETAIKLLESDNYFWNSGIYLLDAKYMNEIYLIIQPSIFHEIKNLINDIEIDNRYYIIPNRYNRCLNISIDNGIMELLPYNSIYMIKYNGFWNDIGTFKSIHDILQKNEFNINISNHINYNSNNCLIDSNKLVLLNNVSNLIISEVDDCILVSDINSSQDIKKVFELTKDKKEIKSNKIDYRPWGYYEILSEFDGYKIKKISVYPSKRLSLQSHNYRKEQWTCIKGSGQAQIDDNFIDLEINKSVFIEINQKHRLINNSKELLEIIEIQLGSYLEEDDIIRYEDDYNRQ